MEMSQSQNQEIKQDKLKTQIVSAITDLEGDRDLVDFSKENRTIDLMSPAQAKSPTPKTTFTPTKQVDRCHKIQCHFCSLCYYQITGAPQPGWAALPCHSSPDVTPRTEARVVTAWLPSCIGTGPAPTQSIDFIQDHVAFALKWHF